MSKKNTKAAASKNIEIDVAVDEQPKPKAASKPIAAAPSAPAIPADQRLSRDEYRALSPEEKRKYREARRASRMAWGAQQARILERATVRLKKLRALATGTAEEQAIAKLASAAMEAMTDLTPKLHAFEGTPSSVAKAAEKVAKFEPGTVVSVIEKRRAAYEGLIENMDKLVVKTVSGKRLVLESTEGIRLVLPTNMVRPVK